MRDNVEVRRECWCFACEVKCESTDIIGELAVDHSDNAIFVTQSLTDRDLVEQFSLGLRLLRVQLYV